MHIHDDETWSTRTGWIPSSMVLTIPGGCGKPLENSGKISVSSLGSDLLFVFSILHSSWNIDLYGPHQWMLMTLPSGWIQLEVRGGEEEEGPFASSLCFLPIKLPPASSVPRLKVIASLM